MRLFEEHIKRQVKSLNGDWRFCPDPEDRGEGEGWYHGLKDAQKVLVPGAWNTDLRLLSYEGAAWYEKKFYTEGGTLRLSFEGVMTEAKVWLDGQYLGDHYGGFCEFSFVARGVTAGCHTVTVRVDNRFDARSIPQARVDWYHYGGITRDVRVERLVGISVLWQRFVYTLAEDLGSATGHFELELYNAEDHAVDTTLRVQIEGEEVFSRKVSLAAREWVTLKTDSITVKAPRLWDTQKPELYDIALLTDTDDCRDRIGFRVIEVKDGAIYLNHRELLLCGINRHEEHPDWGMAFPPKLMEKDLEIVTNMGCNSLRGSHYPNARAFLDMLDERGITFWSEIPIWGCGFAPEVLADPAVIARGLAMHREMVRCYYNHPSIIIWGMHNEIRTDTEGAVEMSKQYYGYLKATGGNRIVTYAANRYKDDLCMAYCDIHAINKYIGWYGSTPDYVATWKEFLEEFREIRAGLGMTHKPLVMGEFGAAAVYGYHTFEALKGTEEYQAELLSNCLHIFYDDPMIKGTYVWQFADIHTAREMGLDRARGFNNKGVLNEYRRPKAGFYAVQRAYGEIDKSKK